MGGSEIVQAVVGTAQAVLLLFSLVYTRRTLNDARSERREEVGRFEQTRTEEAGRRRAEATKARQADLERRLERVLDRIVDIEELRFEMLGGSTSAMLRVPTAMTRLRAAVVATGMELPQTHGLVDLPQGQMLPADQAVGAALAEIQESMRILATAARVPVEGE